ncbi:MAG: hypothetical protein ACJAZ9_000168 [Neolewinella sp.]|jgi:hypothetical protein
MIRILKFLSPYIRCVELRDWSAFYTSDKLLRLRQQKMYLMKKGFPKPKVNVSPCSFTLLWTRISTPLNHHVRAQRRAKRLLAAQKHLPQI